jgi:putative oxidoreductase
MDKTWRMAQSLHGGMVIDRRQTGDQEETMKNLSLLFLRLVVGTLLAGHGAQKLFGWFKGPGLKGTHGFMETLGMKPGIVWGTAAAIGEFSGGTLTALGFLNPVGPINVAAVMAVAVRKAHWRMPIWASEGGAELALTNMAAATALAMTGPGKYSLDGALGLKLPRWFTALALLATGSATVAALQRPDLAQKALDTVSGRVPAQFNRGQDTDVEIETRPAPEGARADV